MGSYAYGDGSIGVDEIGRSIRKKNSFRRLYVKFGMIEMEKQHHGKEKCMGKISGRRTTR